MFVQIAGVVKDGTKAISENVLIAPPAVITSTSMLGVTYQNWVYILTAICTVLHIMRLLPKAASGVKRLVTCFICFSRKHKCDNQCSVMPTTE